MSVYSGFGWSFKREPPSEESPPSPRNRDGSVSSTVSEATETTMDAPTESHYFVIEDRINIVVVRIFILSLQIIGVAVVLYAALYVVSDIIVRLAFVANNVAYEMLLFCKSFLAIVAVLFVVFLVGRFTLAYFLD